jgi:hypothetical protein
LVVDVGNVVVVRLTIRAVVAAVAVLAASAVAVSGAVNRNALAGCGASALQLQLGGTVVPKTQQSPLLLRLVNRGSRSCTLDGYPRMMLDGPSGSAYPFAYRDRGDQEVTSRSPSTVIVRAGATAWVLINKNACVTSDQGRATKVALIPPGAAPSP